MQKIARKILEKYVFEKKIPSIEELDLVSNPWTKKSETMAFVTLYLDKKVVASSGRVHPKKSNTMLELIENTLLCLKDDRIQILQKVPNKIKKLKYRVDLIHEMKQRRKIDSVSELNFPKEWLILMSVKYGKISIVLPEIHKNITDAEMLFKIAKKKMSLENEDVRDLALFAVESTKFSDL